jgi:GrpB-like predicted nucleotidyltransferase (UPF0157 family)
MYGMNRKELRLMPHDPSWKEDFEAEKARILSAVNDPTVQIEHVGSTAIPTVHAKPILDIAILCGEKGLEPVANALESLKYDYRGQFDDEASHFYAVLDRGERRLCQAHIYTQANADWRSKLKFRDRLREDAALASEYNDYKLNLAKEVSDKSVYAEIKSKWVDTFILKIL